jgi:hypothetical protein
MQEKNYNMKKIINPLEYFRYLGITLTNENSIRGEIKSRLKSGNACYHLEQNLFSSSLQIEVRECLLSFGAESFVFQFAIQKCKD